MVKMIIKLLNGQPKIFVAPLMPSTDSPIKYHKPIFKSFPLKTIPLLVVGKFQFVQRKSRENIISISKPNFFEMAGDTDKFFLIIWVHSHHFMFSISKVSFLVSSI